jgi:hypothetical protein
MSRIDIDLKMFARCPIRWTGWMPSDLATRGNAMDNDIYLRVAQEHNEPDPQARTREQVREQVREQAGDRGLWGVGEQESRSAEIAKSRDRIQELPAGSDEADAAGRILAGDRVSLSEEARVLAHMGAESVKDLDETIEAIRRQHLDIIRRRIRERRQELARVQSADMGKGEKSQRVARLSDELVDLTAALARLAREDEKHQAGEHVPDSGQKTNSDQEPDHKPVRESGRESQGTAPASRRDGDEPA